MFRSFARTWVSGIWRTPCTPYVNWQWRQWKWKWQWWRTAGVAAYRKRMPGNSRVSQPAVDVGWTSAERRTARSLPGCTRHWQWSRNSAADTLPPWDHPVWARYRDSAETHTPMVFGQFIQAKTSNYRIFIFFLLQFCKVNNLVIHFKNQKNKIRNKFISM